MSDWKSGIFVLMLFVVAIAMLADLSTQPRSNFTQANYDRLEIGMTMDDAIAILGEPDTIDESMREIRWAYWYSPFDVESHISGIFVFPAGTLRKKEKTRELPDRPLLMPDSLPRREIPSYILHLLKHQQDQERRATLMLDPPSNVPFIP